MKPWPRPSAAVRTRESSPRRSKPGMYPVFLKEIMYLFAYSRGVGDNWKSREGDLIEAHGIRRHTTLFVLS